MMYFAAFAAGAFVFCLGCFVGAALASIANMPSGGIVATPEDASDQDGAEIINFNPRKDK